MDDLDQKQPDSTGDDRVEFVNLDAIQPGKDAAHEEHGRHRVADVPTSQLLFLRRRRVQVTITAAILLAALVVLLSVSGGFAWLAAKVQPNTAAQPSLVSRAGIYKLPALPQQDGIACLINAAWSPDSEEIAVLGYDDYCPLYQSAPPPGIVNIYNAASRKMAVQIRLDPLLDTAIKQRFPRLTGAFTIDYEWARWSPDGKYLAMPFFVSEASSINVAGLLLLSNNDHRVLMQQISIANPLITYPYYFEWDLSAGKLATMYDQETSPNASGVLPNIPFAPAYTWGVHGQLMPISNPPAKAGPVGNPIGGNSFTIWQTGYVSRVTQFETGPLHLPGVYTWSTQFAAWSPDGRYLIDSISTGGRFIMPHQAPPSSQTLSDLRLDQLSPLTIRDKALASILDSLEIFSSSVTVAWRPDGRELATLNAGRIEVYDCTTGKKLASLIPPGNPAGLSGSETFSWSPDGSRLLLSSNIWGVLSVWGPGQLPR